MNDAPNILQARKCTPSVYNDAAAWIAPAVWNDFLFVHRISTLCFHSIYLAQPAQDGQHMHHSGQGCRQWRGGTYSNMQTSSPRTCRQTAPVSWSGAAAAVPSCAPTPAAHRTPRPRSRTSRLSSRAGSRHRHCPRGRRLVWRRNRRATWLRVDVVALLGRRCEVGPKRSLVGDGRGGSVLTASRGPNNTSSRPELRGVGGATSIADGPVGRLCVVGGCGGAGGAAADACCGSSATGSFIGQPAGHCRRPGPGIGMPVDRVVAGRPHWLRGVGAARSRWQTEGTYLIT